MNEVVSVGIGVWLGIVEPDEPVTGRGPARYRLERAASRRALALARRALPVPARAVSLSHSEGAGAALLSATRRRVGVDVARGSRIEARHARAILSAEEWRLVGGYSRAGAALAWCLKEAAAKATGVPAEVFPDLLRLRFLPRGGLGVTALGPRPLDLEAGWLERPPFLFGWVLSVGPQSKRASR